MPDHVSLWGLLIPMRRGFQQYVNLRPVRLLAGVESPLRDRAPGDIDFYVVRENNEGEYSAIGGRLYEGTDHEMAMQEAVFTRRGCDRIMRYAFELARHAQEARHLGDQVERHHPHDAVSGTSASPRSRSDYPDVKTDQYHIDILTAHFVRHPDWFDVVVGSNLFGDILSDLGPAVRRLDRHRAVRPTSTPSANIPRCSSRCTARRRTSPASGIANPIGQIWSGAMMLDHFGESAAAAADRARDRRGAGRRRHPHPRSRRQRRHAKDLGAAIAAAIR